MNDEHHWVEAWILKVGRRFCIFVGSVAILAVAAGALTLLVTGLYWVFGKPEEPSPLPEVKPPALITLADAKKNMKPEFQFNDGPGDVPQVEDSTLARATVLKDLFPEQQYTWDEVFQDYCRVPSSYGCIEHGRRVSRRGVGKFIAAVLEAIPTEEQDAAVTNLQRLLKEVSVGERANLVAPIVATYHRQVLTQEQLESERNAQNQKREFEWQADVQSYEGRRVLMGLGGLYSIASGLAAALGICTVVALLAIERHLRGRSPATEAAAKAHS